MRLRPRRGNLVIWSSSSVPNSGSWAWRPARPRRIRWLLRTGTLLALIGLMRLARATRTHWEPVSLAAPPEVVAPPDVQAEGAAVEKELGDTGRVLLRPSGTEPLVRVMVEAA